MLNALALGDKRSLVPVDRFSRLAHNVSPARLTDIQRSMHLQSARARRKSALARQINETRPPSKRRCESGMKVFSTRTLYFMGFYARELSVFFCKKNSRRTRRAKPSGFAAPTQGQNPQQYES
jgi:hypothetical protein